MNVVLTIAGSDSSGGAGIQADLKTFESFGLFGTSAITVLTAQNTQGVDAIEPLSTHFVKAQINSVLKDFDVSAIKIGMLYSKEIIEAVKEVIVPLNIPIVFDPVFISKAGASLLKPDAVEAMRTLFSYATVLTPNRHEAEALFGFVKDEQQALVMLEALGVPVLVKNFKNENSTHMVSYDTLYRDGSIFNFESEYIPTDNLHGTGCSFSSAIAANLALGHDLDDSITRAKAFVSTALRYAPNIGHGPGPINHKKGGTVNV